jgi:putative chitinase
VGIVARFGTFIFAAVCGFASGTALSQDNPAARCECQGALSGPVESGSSIVTAERLARFSPRARADLTLAIIRLWRSPEPAELVTPLRVQHFFAQIATETGGFARIDENMNYSARRLLQVFPRRVTPEQAQRLANRPERIANHVYGGRLGNREPGDGWLYRGSGFMQLTGRANFRDRGIMIGRPLEAQPELVRQPEPGFETAAAYWTARRINDAADRDNLTTVRKLVNGGTNGLAESKVWLARAKRIFVDGTGPQESSPGETAPIEAAPEALSPEELAAVEDILAADGLYQRGPQESANDGSVSPELREALREFQIENNLPATGEYDEDTLYALGTPDPVEPLTDEDVATVESQLQQRGLLSPAEASGPEEVADALSRFQVQEGLPVTGIFDEATLELLLPSAP